jgi:hypothetical protein
MLFQRRADVALTSAKEAAMQSYPGAERGVWPRRRLWCAIVAGAVLLGGVPLADAALTTPSCLAKKLKEWGKLRKCQAIENGKALQAKPADPGKCQTKFDAKLALISAQATAGGIPCRYGDGDNGDGTTTDSDLTVMDYDTGLMWEKKADLDVCEPYSVCGIHDVLDTHDWAPGPSGVDWLPTGTAFWGFLGVLNYHTVNGSDGCFAGHCDWRLPSIGELQTILLAPYPCGTNPCIDETVFGPTASADYWSATSDADDPQAAWLVYFVEGDPFPGDKLISAAVRAVRSAL